ncbi:MAG: nuclear transport factor 2 family protein [Chitinophagaceae bacterium]
MNNKKIIQNAFENWERGQGSFFDLLDDDVEWTITGTSPVSGKYTSRKQFIDEVINPLNERLSEKIIPRLLGLYAEDDMVIALWEGNAMAKDNKPYHNVYSWYMKMKKGKIVEATAFFDTITFREIWERIPVPVSP